ncbi:UPF0147 family protein [Candidatus Woesearchaeota archaeon]|nr:UPF0147 family protein [Candidatus Woesearchaeota archaeon]
MMTKMVSKKISDMIGLLEELQNDSAVPRNVKDRLVFCTNALQEDTEVSLKVDKVKQALEQISEDSNLEAYTRTQLWNLASLLEKL